MKKAIYMLIIAVALAAVCASSAYAADGLWRKDKTGWYWTDNNGTRAVSCWKWCDGNGDGTAECYCFSPEGYCYLDCTTPDGYLVNPDGAWIEGGKVQTKAVPVKKTAAGPDYSQARAKLNEVGGTLEAAYNWAKSIRYVADYALEPSLGIRHYAERGFTTGEGDCFDMACCLCEMSRVLGLNARCMSGYVPLRGGRGISPHCWCEIDIDGKTYVFDPDFEYETGKSGYMIAYKQPGTWRYTDWTEMHD